MMKKKAQVAGVWPQIYNKLKSPPPGMNLGTFPSRLPPQHQVTFDTSPPADNASAVAYVSSGDANNDGKIDKIHIVVPKLEQQLSSMGINPSNISDKENLSKLLMAFVEILSHEMGHMKDFSPQGGNVFPGGEGVADSAARQAIQEISVQATNIHNKFEKLSFSNRRFKMLNTVKVLTKLANDLDKKGEHKLADDVDSVIQKIAESDEDLARRLRSGDIPTQQEERLEEAVDKRHRATVPRSSIKALQVNIGAEVSGIWNANTQNSWESFIDRNVDAVLEVGHEGLLDDVQKEPFVKEVKSNWSSAARRMSLSPTISGAIKFVDMVQAIKRRLKAGEAPAAPVESTRPAREFQRARSLSGPFNVNSYNQIAPHASDKSKKIKKEAAKKPSLEQVLNTSFSAPTRKPFNR